jgi:hypothetical protein
MSYDARIILGGRSPDIVNALASGDMARQQRLDFDNQNAMRDMLRTNGAGIMAGDQQALNALAQFDPSAALGIQTQRQEMAYNDKRLSVLGETEKRAAAEYAAGLTAEQRAAEAAELEGAVKQALAAPTPEAFDAMMIAMGRQDMVGQFANRQALAAPFMEIADILKMNAGPEVDLTASQKDYNFYSAQETAAGRQPLSFNEWDLQSKKAGATNVTVGTGPAPADVAAFNKGVKSSNVNEVISDIRSTMAGATLPTTGAIGAGLSSIGGTAAGDVRANVDTLKAAASFSALQAMRDASKTGAALGAVSDTEIRLLSAELANLEQSQSQEQFLRNLDRFERVYNEIVNGPAGAEAAQPSAGGGPVQVTSDADYDALPSGTEFVGPDGKTRRKP